MTAPARPEDLPEKLLSLVSYTREVYVRLLDSALGAPETAGACFYACVLLQTTVNRFSDYRAVVRGGDGHLDGGYTDFAGRRHGHYWVEARAADQRAWVLDITADQFGGPAVTVLPLGYSTPRYLPGDQAAVDAHLREHGRF